MFPIEDGSATDGESTGRELTARTPVDGVRVVVQAMLAVYLSPVILVVCLIGAASILVSKTTRFAVKFVQERNLHLSSATQTPLSTPRPRMIYRKLRSRSIR